MSNPGSQYQILVVDDSPVMRKGIINLLQEHIQADFLEANDGQAAVDMYKEAQPDLVTMDVNMPGMDGMEALKKILGFDQKAKVVMLTTEAEKQKIIEAVSMGAKSYIVKPMDRDKALQKIKNTLEL